jgi:bifunctional UDP-N-acetylglucosamine pyrophosphorylase/glucosamine-1-phosphate N-acetyltransferase
MKLKAIIMAAGQGTRMHSKLPKVLHPLLGQPLIQYSVNTTTQVTGDKPVVVIGHGGEAVRQELGARAEYVLQAEQLGTGHAVQQAESLLRGNADFVLIVAADMPLLTETTLQRLVEAQKANSGPLTLLTLETDHPRGFGRVMRDEKGDVRAIVEEAQATSEQLAIKELNAGAYCMRAEWLWDALNDISLSPKGEYYLTDLVAIAVTDGATVRAVRLEESGEAIGINTRVHLAEAEALLRARINREWMLAGVTLIDPATTYIEPAVTLGTDTIIWPNTHLRGASLSGDNCEIGPNTIIHSAQIGDHCQVRSSVLEEAVVEDGVEIGPFAHLRKGAHLASGVHMGNFGEVKNSYLGPGTKMGHFSYLGDATIAGNVNIGAGTITCNFDGKQKHATVIEENVFIGSDTMLVAPVKIGEGARTGAGSVVTKDVPPYTLTVGVPARPIRKLEK